MISRKSRIISLLNPHPGGKMKEVMDEWTKNSGRKSWSSSAKSGNTRRIWKI